MQRLPVVVLPALTNHSTAGRDRTSAVSGNGVSHIEWIASTMQAADAEASAAKLSKLSGARQRPRTVTLTRATPCLCMPITPAAPFDRSMMRPAM